MGLRPQVEAAAHIATRDLTFVDAKGKVIGSSLSDQRTVNEAVRDVVELPRGELTTLLYGLTKDKRIRYRFKNRSRQSRMTRRRGCPLHER